MQVLTWCDGMGVEPDDPRLNPYGGAIACGHPLAATGVRLMAQLAHGFRERPDVRYGLTALCIGLGMGAAVALGERAQRWLDPTRVQAPAGPRRRSGAVALVTMDNGEDWQKPNTFGEAALRSLQDAPRPSRGRRLGRPRAHRQAVRLRRRRGHRRVRRDHARARPRGQARPATSSSDASARCRSPRSLPINGAALGGGVEIALHCDYRTISADVRHFACPEVLLGLIPGWGGTQLIPRLVGRRAGGPLHRREPAPPEPDAERAGRRSRPGSPSALLEPVEFLDESLAFLVALDRGRPQEARSEPRTSPISDEVVRKARSRVDDQVHGAAPAPYRALDLIEGAGSWSIEEGYRAEEDALAELLPGPQAQASVYAFFLVERRAKRAVDLPEAEPRRVSQGRDRRRRADGEPARARSSCVASRCRSCSATSTQESGRRRDRLRSGASSAGSSPGPDDGGQGAASSARSRAAGRTGTSSPAATSCSRPCIEELDVKKDVFAELERVVSPGLRARDEHVLAVRDRDGRISTPGAPRRHALLQPGRRAAARRARPHAGDRRHVDRDCLGTSTKKLRKTGVLVRDAPAFVVNRLLGRSGRRRDRGARPREHGRGDGRGRPPARRPMAPSFLLQLVGPKVANHVRHTLHDAGRTASRSRRPWTAIAEDGEPVVVEHAPQQRRGDPRGRARGARRRGPAPARGGRRRGGGGHRHLPASSARAIRSGSAASRSTSTRPACPSGSRAVSSARPAPASHADITVCGAHF